MEKTEKDRYEGKERGRKKESLVYLDDDCNYIKTPFPILS